MYLLRLDDASDYMDVVKWRRVERLFDKYGVKPLVGVIPDNHDSKFVDAYERDDGFWTKAKAWEAKGWTLALHGWHHVYTTKCVGINPAGRKSEFAGVPLESQCEMIRDGLAILKSRRIEPKVFFAPSHTYDNNTLEALRRESDIRIISDTVANDVYFRWGFYFIPVQSGRCRSLPLKLVTICLHPNLMSEEGFFKLEQFIRAHKDEITSFGEINLDGRVRSSFDKLLQLVYCLVKKLKS